MGAAEQNKKRVMEENDILKQFMEILNQQNMGEQSQDLMELFQYFADMKSQLTAMTNELQGVREQLSLMRDYQPKSAAENLMDKADHLQEKITSLSERLSVIKDNLVETALQAVDAFKEKGKVEMCKVFRKGISGVKSMLAGYREHLVDVMINYEKTANQINSIGDELKQIGNSVSNVGRLLAGKGTKEISDEKPGVGLTRAISKSVEKLMDKLQKKIDMVDKSFEKLERLSGRLEAGKEVEKGGRVSVKGELLKMKAKIEQRNNAPEPGKEKLKSKEACL